MDGIELKNFILQVFRENGKHGELADKISEDITNKLLYGFIVRARKTTPDWKVEPQLAKINIKI